MKKFTTAQLDARLSKARQQTASEGTIVPFPLRYAQLAFLDVPADAHERLGRLSIWPVELYDEAPVPLRLEVLKWLLTHVNQVRRLDQKHGWREQWHLARIRLRPPTENEAEVIGKFLETRQGSKHPAELFSALEARHPTPQLALSRLKHHMGNRRWGVVVDAAPRDLERVYQPMARRSIWALYATALLARGEGSKDGGLTDAERAYHALLTAQREGVLDATLGELLARALRDALPADLEAGRGESTNVVADGYRGLTRMGKRLGKLFGGREATVPTSEAVVASAPALLPAGAVEVSLNGSGRHATEFRRSVGWGGGDLEAAAVGGAVTVGGLWTLSQIDGTVLDAMTFSSAANPESFWRLREVAGGMEDNAGAATRLSGYVAEQQVAVDLVRGGHMVEFPDSASQRGFDLLVDGSPVQVKCSLSADYVMEHFDRYPDIPVVVNAELAEQLGDHPMVWVDLALSHADVHQATDATVDALAGFGDADDLLPVPVLSLAFATYRNYGDFKAGRIDEGAFAARVGVDTAARAIGGGLCGLIGGLIGSVVPGPGTVIGAGIGSFLGSVAGGTGADSINREAVCDARDQVVARLSDFARWFHAELLGPRVTALGEKRQQVAAWAEGASAEAWAPACVATMHAAAVEAETRAKGLAEWMRPRLRGDDFARANAGLVALREANRFLHPGLKTRLAELKTATDAYQAVVNPDAAGSPAPAPA